MELIHKEGPFHFSTSRDGKIQIELPDGHGPGLTYEELKQLAHGARHVTGLITNGLPVPTPICRHRCRTCDEVWSHDPLKLECVWAYDELCGECAGK
jgi:hypothetical protein